MSRMDVPDSRNPDMEEYYGYKRENGFISFTYEFVLLFSALKTLPKVCENATIKI